MNSRHPALTALAAGLLTALAATAFAASGGTTTTNTESGKLASTYTTFAGSNTNADALVQGLRNGSPITLETTTTVKNANGTTTTATTPTTFQPDTRKLGYGNVNIALALAEAQLTKLGITDPTAAEIEAALNGGSVTSADGHTETLQGVLALRAKGEGWGRISHALGTGKLGTVVSAASHDHSRAGIVHASHPEHHGRPADLQQPMHPVHPDHPMAPERPSVPSHPDHPTHAGRPGG